MKKLYHPGTSCRNKIANFYMHTSEIKGNNLEAVSCKDGWAIFGEDSYWIDNSEFLALERIKPIKIYRNPDISFKGWGFYSPIELELEITRECNQKCIHCYNESGRDISLNIKTLDNLIKEFREYGGQTIKISGGEPLAYQYILDFLENARKHGTRHIELNTNGSLVDKIGAGILTTYINTFNVSLHASNSSLFSKITNSNNFNDVLKAIEQLKNQGTEVIINFTIMKENIKDISPLFALVKNLDINKIKFNRLINAGYGSKLEKVSDDDIQILRKEISELSGHFNIKLERSELYTQTYSIGLEKAKYHGCEAFRNKAYIDAFGNVMPCSLVLQSIGNINNIPLIKIWHNDLANRVRELTFCDICRADCSGKCKYKEITSILSF